MSSTERFNVLSHLAGAVMAALGLAMLLVLAARTGDPWRIASLSVYGTTLVLVYLTSTLYHVSQGRARLVLKKLDHLAIYLLIAGTYTPFALVSLAGAWGWTLFGINWALALVGSAITLVADPGHRGWRAVSHALYLVMGWLALIAIVPLFRALGPWGTGWVVAGGVVYTAGMAAYVSKTLPRNHEIWHVFVLGGSVCHFVAVVGWVV
jgi:hemolysin III